MSSPEHVAALVELKDQLRSNDVSILTSAEELSGPIAGRVIALHIEGAMPASVMHLAPEIASRLVLFLERPSEADLQEIGGSSSPAAIVVKQGALSVDEMRGAVQKILAPAPLGIGCYLPDSAPIQRVALTHSTQRGQALEAIDRFISGLTLDARRVAQVLTIADEFITNAFYHAPVDGTGRHPYTHLPRIDPVQCRADHPIELSFANNGTRVAIAVRDLYGSLEPTHALRHLAKAVSDPRANFKITTGSGGARLGLITAFRAASQLIFNVVPDVVTECIGLIEMGGNYRQFLETGKLLHVYTLRESVAG